MNFERTIQTALQKNGENSRNQVKYYSSKFEPPKKLERSKKLSANIQKFLARKEEEEKQKAVEARERRDKLLELRSHDKKATRRVNVMLKRTKSANQSAIQDAVGDHTSVTMAGPSQPDEDDYGYVSQSAADYYNKMMEKYNKMPNEPKWDFTKKKSNGSLSNTKDRVRNALNKEEEEAMQPHRRKRRQHGEREAYDRYEPSTDDKYKKEEKSNNKPKIKAAPVINFNDLLKMAEKKQFEPVKVEPKKEKKEEERPLTKKQKLEQEKEREYRDQRDKREKDRALGITPSAPAPGRIPKVASSEAKSSSPKPNGSSNSNDRRPPNSTNSLNSSRKDLNPPNNKSKPPPQKCDINNKRSELPVKHATNGHSAIRKDSRDPPPSQRSSNNGYSTSREPQRGDPPRKSSNGVVGKPRELPSSRDAKPKEFPPRDLKPKQFPPRDLKPKQFPPPDVRRNGPPAKRKPMHINKGRIYDDDDEEYDSEMDDFIDDGPEEEEDYSKHIRELFGYDKRKYRHLDDDDDNMESSFAQQMREEVISTKIGIMEDLEEQRKEDEHNRRKAMMKRKR